jgi:hypothetical protein
VHSEREQLPALPSGFGNCSVTVASVTSQIPVPMLSFPTLAVIETTSPFRCTMFKPEPQS